MVENFTAPKDVSEALTRAAAMEKGLTDWLVTRDGKKVTSVEDKGPSFIYRFKMTPSAGAEFNVAANGKYLLGEVDIYDDARGLDILLTVPDWYTKPEPKGIDDTTELVEIPADQWFPDKLVTSGGLPVHSCGFIGDRTDWRWLVLSEGDVPFLCNQYGTAIEGWSVSLKPREPYSQIVTARRNSMHDNWYVFELDSRAPLPRIGQKFLLTEITEDA